MAIDPGQVAGTLSRGAAQAERQKEKQGPFDIWTTTGEGIAENARRTLADPAGAMRAEAEGRARQARAMLPDQWGRSDLASTGDAVVASAGETGEAFGKIADAEGALATTGAIFGALTSLEQTLSVPFSAIPFPAFPAVRITDMAVGLPHGHAHPPNLIPPAPMIPLPSAGPVIPIPYVSGAATVLINNMPAARCGDMGLGIWCGGYFPMYEIFLGSSSVWLEGSRAARLAVDITKHCIFSSPKPSDPPVGPMVGTTVSSSPNVVIGGVPMPSLMSMAIGAAFKAVFKGLGKVRNMARAADDVPFSRTRASEFPEGQGYAKKVSPGGTGDGLAGHGEFRSQSTWPQTIRVPEGVTITLPPRGVKLPDEVGRLMEEGDWDGLARHLEANPHHWDRVEGMRTYLPGEEIPNYTLKAPDGLHIKENSITVVDPTTLETILGAYKGTGRNLVWGGVHCAKGGLMAMKIGFARDDLSEGPWGSSTDGPITATFVGWLAAEWIGLARPADAIAREALVASLVRLYFRPDTGAGPRNLERSIDPCPLCGATVYISSSGLFATAFSDAEVKVARARVARDVDWDVLGHAEFWLPKAQPPSFFVSPSLILHFVERHDYWPPEEYRERAANLAPK